MPQRNLLITGLSVNTRETMTPPLERLRVILGSVFTRKGFAIKADSADLTAVQRAVAQAVEMFRRLDIVEVNAGILLLGSIETVSHGTMNRMPDINVRRRGTNSV
jgi:NADP-dependent 3-hydroxy acid dehydrogenase YdfG